MDTSANSTSPTVSLGATFTIQPGSYLVVTGANGGTTSASQPTTEGAYSTAGSSENSRPYNTDIFRSGVATSTLGASAVMPSSLGTLNSATDIQLLIPYFGLMP